MDDPKGLVECRVYKKRWLMLFLFVLYSMVNYMQWLEYAIIANIIERFYGVPSIYVDWTSMIYMVTYTVFVFPASWVIDKLGLRVAVLLGAIGTCVGSWVKVFSVMPDRFYITFIGQFILALSFNLMLAVPAPLAATWFGSHEVSTACSIGVLGSQFGVLMGYLIPTVMVKNSENTDVIATDLSKLFYSVAISSTILLFILIFFFQDAPDLPPSPAQAGQSKAEPVPFATSVKNLLTNRGYLLLLISYGIILGVVNSLSTLLNQLILNHFPDKVEYAGRLGVSGVLAGLVASVIGGILLDKTHKFKEVTLAFYLSSLVSMIVLTFTLGSNDTIIVFISVTMVGLSLAGYIPVGVELAAELTYPEPEGTSAGLLNASGQAFGILFTLVCDGIISNLGDLWANMLLCCALMVGLGLVTLIPFDLRRQEANTKLSQT